MLKPLTAMITHAKSAAQSSAVSQPGPPQSAMLIPTNAAPEVSASDQWCSASMFSAVLPTSAPARPIRREKATFARMTAASSTSVHHSGPRCGIMISRTACTASQPAMRKTKTATDRPASGSALPWP